MIRFLLKKTGLVCSDNAGVFAILGAIIAGFITVAILWAIIKKTSEEWKKLNMRISNMEIFGLIIMGFVVWRELNFIFSEFGRFDFWHLFDTFGIVLFLFGWFLKWLGLQQRLQELIDAAKKELAWQRFRVERDTFVRAMYLFRAWQASPDKGRTISFEGSTRYQNAVNRLEAFNSKCSSEQTNVFKKINEEVRCFLTKPSTAISSSLDVVAGANSRLTPIASPESANLLTTRENATIPVVEPKPVPFAGNVRLHPLTAIQDAKQQCIQALTAVQEAKQHPKARKHKKLRELLAIHEELIAVLHEEMENTVDSVDQLSELYSPEGALPKYDNLLDIRLPIPYTLYENKADFSRVDSINLDLRLRENRDRVQFDQFVGKLVKQLFNTVGYIVARTSTASMKDESNDILFVGIIVHNKRTGDDELAYNLIEFNLIHDMVHSLHLYKGCFPNPETSFTREKLDYQATTIIAGPSTGKYEIVRYTQNGEPVERPILYWVPSFSSETEAKRDNLAEEISERCATSFKADYEEDVPQNSDRDYVDEYQD